MSSTRVVLKNSGVFESFNNSTITYNTYVNPYIIPIKTKKSCSEIFGTLDLKFNLNASIEINGGYKFRVFGYAWSCNYQNDEVGFFPDHEIDPMESYMVYKALGTPDITVSYDSFGCGYASQ